MAGRLLHVAQRYASVEGGGDEGVPQRVRPDSPGGPGASGDASHDPPGGVAVESSTIEVDEDRPVVAFADRQVDRPGASMSAPIASDTRSPFNASNDTSA